MEDQYSTKYTELYKLLEDELTKFYGDGENPERPSNGELLRGCLEGILDIRFRILRAGLELTFEEFAILHKDVNQLDTMYRGTLELNWGGERRKELA